MNGGRTWMPLRRKSSMNSFATVCCVGESVLKMAGVLHTSAIA